MMISLNILSQTDSIIFASITGNYSIKCKIIRVGSDRIYYKYYNNSDTLKYGIVKSGTAFLNTITEYKSDNIWHIGAFIEKEQNTIIVNNILSDNAKYNIKTDTLQSIMLITSKLENKLQCIQYNLLKCNQTYTTGVECIIVGILFNVIGGIAMVYDELTPAYTLMGTGGILTVIGGITIISSHKYIGEAGSCK